MNEATTARQISISESVPDKPPKEVLPVTKALLTEALKADFTAQGIANEFPLALRIIQCESGFRVDPPHNNSSRGIFQFQRQTWDEQCQGSILNPYNQISCAAKLIKAGELWRWSASKSCWGG